MAKVKYVAGGMQFTGPAASKRVRKFAQDKADSEGKEVVIKKVTTSGYYTDGRGDLKPNQRVEFLNSAMPKKQASNPHVVSLAQLDSALRRAGKTVAVTITGASAAAIKKALALTPGGKRKAKSAAMVRRVLGNPSIKPNLQWRTTSKEHARVILSKLKRYYRHAFKGSKVVPVGYGYGLLIRGTTGSGITLAQVPAILRQWGA